MFGRQETLVVDLGTFYVKVLRIVPTKGGGKATGFHFKETGLTSPNPQLNDELRDSYIQALSLLLKENSVKTRRAILAIPGRSIFSRPLKIPPVAGDRLARIVEFEARQHLPFPLEEVRMEHQAFPTQEGEMDVALLAVKRDALSFYIDVLRKCGLSPVSVDVSSLALYNTYANGDQKKPEDEVVALVDIGASTSDIVIESRGVLKFMRRARVGGNSLTSMLAQEINQSFEEAERIKVRSSEEGLPELTSTSKISEILLRGFERLANDLKNTLDFYVSRPDGLPVNRLYITGGTSRFASLVPFLEERLGIPVEVMRPFQAQAIDMEAISDERLGDLSAVAVGLALKSVRHAEVDLNFTPEYILEQQELAKRRPALAVQGALAVGIVGCLMYIANAELALLRSAQSQISTIANQAELSEGRIGELLEEDRLLSDRFKNLSIASELRGRSVRYLLEIGKIKPQSVWVKTLSVSTRAITMIVGGDLQGIDNFVRLIKISPYFLPESVINTPIGDLQEIRIDNPVVPFEETRFVYEEMQRENLKLFDKFLYLPMHPTVIVGLVADAQEMEDVFRRLANAVVAAKSKVEDYGKTAAESRVREAVPGAPTAPATIETVYVEIFDSVYAAQFGVTIPFATLEELQKQNMDWNAFDQFLRENQKPLSRQ